MSNLRCIFVFKNALKYIEWSMASESALLKLDFILLCNLFIRSTLYTQYNYNKTIFCLIIILNHKGLMFIISWGKNGSLYMNEILPSS